MPAGPRCTHTSLAATVRAAFHLCEWNDSVAGEVGQTWHRMRACVHRLVDNHDQAEKQERTGGLFFGATQGTTHIYQVPSMSPWGICMNSSILTTALQ